MAILSNSLIVYTTEYQNSFALSLGLHLSEEEEKHKKESGCGNNFPS